MFDILNGIEVLFFWLGVFSLAVAEILVWLRIKKQAGWLPIGVILTGSVTCLFAIAWAVSSVLEKESQSASVGLTIMLTPGLAILALGIKLLLRPRKQLEG